MRPVCERITLLGPAERMNLIDRSLWDRIVSFDLGGDRAALAREHDLSVAFRTEPLAGFTHAFPPLPPPGVNVYLWLRARAIALGGEPRDVAVPQSDGAGTIIAPGSGSQRKNAPLVTFLEAARRSSSEREPVFVLGPAESREMEERIGEAGFRVERPATLAELDRLVASQAVFHGNDSGIMHLAALRGLETHLHLVDRASRDWIPPGRVVVHEVVPS